MARDGQAGAALAIVAPGSFFCRYRGYVDDRCAFALPVALGPLVWTSGLRVALDPGAGPNVILASGSLFKAVATDLAGVLVRTVGTDLTTGTARYIFEPFELIDGLGIYRAGHGAFRDRRHHRQCRTKRGAARSCTGRFPTSGPIARNCEKRGQPFCGAGVLARFWACCQAVGRRSLRSPPGQYYPVVVWGTVEALTENFRNSPGFQEW